MDAILLWIIIGSVSGALLVGLVVACCLCICSTVGESGGMRDHESQAGVGDEELIRFQGGELLTIDEILNASGEVLGKSSYSTVYKARLLSDGSMIALRLIREGCIKKADEFFPAIHDLGLMRHTHLVSVLAFYAGPRGEKLLVSHFMPRGNLADLVKNPHRQALGWSKLHRIALGAARGLAHLHTGLQSPIIHGNLKSRNVLIDENYEGYICDFSLHQLLNPSSQATMLEASSSQGYKAPELLKLKKANTKTDIYSFGIILLEILTGRKPNGRDSNNQIIDLPTIVKKAVLEERISELFSPLILGGGLRTPNEEGLLRTLQLAMGCCAPSPSIRPDIREVVRQLEKVSPPQSPTFTLSPQCTSDDRSSREFVM